jgi:hypothetical protein
LQQNWKLKGKVKKYRLAGVFSCPRGTTIISNGYAVLPMRRVDGFISAKTMLQPLQVCLTKRNGWPSWMKINFIYLPHFKNNE